MNPTSKLSGERPPNDPSEGLTCSEGQVEDLLSEGESTEEDGEKEKPSKRPSKQDASSRETETTDRPKHRKT